MERFDRYEDEDHDFAGCDRCGMSSTNVVNVSGQNERARLLCPRCFDIEAEEHFQKHGRDRRRSRRSSGRRRFRRDASRPRLYYIGYGYMVTPRTAGELARASGVPLPRHGYEVRVRLPGGEAAHLYRSMHQGRMVWTVRSNQNISHYSAGDARAVGRDRGRRRSRRIRRHR